MKGTGWVLAGKLSSRLLAFLSVIILARLLSPDQFGVFGFVTLAICSLDTVSQIGFDAALIHQRDGSDGMFDTAWTVQAARGVVLAVLLSAAAPLVARFFREPRIVPMLRVLSLSLVLQGLSNIGMVSLRKDLAFGRIFVYDVAAEAAGLAGAVALALIWSGAWALVGGRMISSAVRCGLSFVLHPYRPGIRFNAAEARALFRYGRWMMSSIFLIFVVTHGDSMAVGKLLGAAALGVYQVVYRLSNLAATNVSDAVSSVAFPAYARLQDDPGRLRSAYFRVMSITMSLAAPAALGTAAIAPIFVRVVLGDKWEAAIVPTQILCFYGLAHSLGGTTAPIFFATGQPRVLTIAALLDLIGMAALIWPGTRLWGLKGLCVAVTIPMVLSQIYTLMKVSRTVRTRLRTVLAHAAQPLLAAAAMYLMLTGLASVFPTTIVALVALISTGAAAYALMMLLTAGAGKRREWGILGRNLLGIFGAAGGQTAEGGRT